MCVLQVTDTPGLLSRSDEFRNKMELLTLAALQHLPTSVVFVADLTEDCGTCVREQWNIRSELKARFPEKCWVDVLSKADLLHEVLAEADERLLRSQGAGSSSITSQGGASDHINNDPHIDHVTTRSGNSSNSSSNNSSNSSSNSSSQPTNASISNSSESLNRLASRDGLEQQQHSINQPASEICDDSHASTQLQQQQVSQECHSSTAINSPGCSPAVVDCHQAAAGYSSIDVSPGQASQQLLHAVDYAAAVPMAIRVSSLTHQGLDSLKARIMQLSAAAIVAQAHGFDDVCERLQDEFQLPSS